MTYSKDGQSTSDTVNITPVGREKVRLGYYGVLSRNNIGKIYIPTKYGGTLTLNPEAYVTTGLYYTDGTDLTAEKAIQLHKGELDGSLVAQISGSPLVYEVPENAHGWYYIKYNSTVPLLVYNSFVESGQALNRPWNGWYWPCVPALINLYEPNGTYTPLKDYDTVYGTNERQNEENNFTCSESWWGHCWGWSLAAIAMNQPMPATKNGVVFNQDEMEGLYTELADGAIGGWEWQVGTPLNPIPAGPPTSALGEAVDFWADDVHIALRQYVRNEGRAMYANLRDISGSDASQVWNHDIFAYESNMKEASGGNERIIETTTQIISNTDTPAMPSDTGTRTDTYVYILEYRPEGTIDESSGNQNWISTSGFAPKDIGTVNPLSWHANHCNITKTNVDNLYNP